MLRSPGEQAGEVDQPPRRRIRIPVDRLVVVTDAEHRAIRPGDQPHEQHVGGCQILKLVDEQDAAGALGAVARIGLPQEDLDGPVDLLVEIQLPALAKQAAVAREHVGQPLHVTVIVCLHLRGGAQAQADGRHSLDPGGGGIGVEPPGEVDQAIEQLPNCRLLDGVPLVWAGGEGGSPVDDRQGQGVEGADLQPRHVGAALAHLPGRPVVVGDHAHRARRDPPI